MALVGQTQARRADTMRLIRPLLQLALPAVATSLLHTAVFFTDRLLLGKFSSAALASLQLQGPIVWSISMVFLSLSTSVLALVARYFGANQPVRAWGVTTFALRWSIVAGCIVGCAIYLGHETLIIWLGADNDDVARHANGYLSTIALAFPAIFASGVLSSSLSGVGDTRVVMQVGIAANMLNLAVSFVAVFGVESLGVPAMGAAGAASGSLFAVSLESAVLWWIWKSRAHPSWKQSWQDSARLRGLVVRHLVRLSMPTLGERLLTHLGFVLFTLIVNQLGSVAMAANQSLLMLESICFLAADGFGVAASAMVGQEIGRRRPQEARRVGWLATLLCMAALTSVGVGLWLISPVLLPLAVSGDPLSPAIVAAAFATIPILVIAQPLMAAGVVLAQALRGAGNSRSPMIAGVVGGLVVRVGSAWFIAVQLGAGVWGIWLASTLDWGVRSLWVAWSFRRL